MDTLDWLFAASDQNDCQIVDLEIDVVEVSSESENYSRNFMKKKLSIKNENINDTLDHKTVNCCSPPLFETEDTFSLQIENDDLNIEENINNGNQSIYEEEIYEIEFLEDEVYNETSGNNNKKIIDSEDLKSHEELDNTNDSRGTLFSPDINMTDHSLTKAGNNRKSKKFIMNKTERMKHAKAKQRNNHQLKPPCSSNCKKLCSIKVTNSCRQKINDMFWSMNWCEQGNFVKNMISKSPVSRKTVNSNKRQYTITYSLHDDQEEIQNVCQTFFLATLGYSKNNNTILKRIQCTKNYTTIEKRGKYGRGLEYKEVIKQHIESFNPTISHYRREH